MTFPPADTGPQDASTPTVMLVDDHEDSVAMYAVGLEAMGFQPLTAATAEEAYERACALRPDVVVSDMTLPGSSGLDLTRQLRRDAHTSNTGIILLTGHSGSDVEQQAGEAGCDRFLLKPCMPDALAAEIRAVLAARKGVSAAATP
jgi:two-component system, cell cycle response regulator DivK